MTTERMMLQPGVWLNYVHSDRFKTGCFSFNLLMPLAADTAAPNALIPTVLLRGCEGYPDIQAISRRLDTLYGATVGTLVRKKARHSWSASMRTSWKTGIAAERSCFSR